MFMGGYVSNELFEVLADPTRRQIVEVLRTGERAVNDIVDRVSVHQSGVSRHLRILHEAGFVRVRPEIANTAFATREDQTVHGLLRVWVHRVFLLEGAPQASGHPLGDRSR